MQLNPAAFNSFLQGIGQSFSWRKASACPCLSLHSKSPRADCLQCHGKGLLWAAPVTGTAGISGQKVQRAWAQFGMAQLGDMVVSIGSDSPLYVIGEFDRVVMLNSSVPFSRVLTRGNDVLHQTPQVIDSVFWLDGNQAIVAGGIPAVAGDCSLTWATGAPPDVQQYTMSGRELPEYFVYMDFPSDRSHHHGADLPVKVVLRKFDLLGR